MSIELHDTEYLKFLVEHNKWAIKNKVLINTHRIHKAKELIKNAEAELKTRTAENVNE